jgi:ribosome-binding protein aMBF1 (putative translation factor)
MSAKRCVICKKPHEIVELYEGLFDNEMVMVCESCALEEKIPILRKPSGDQLKEVDKRYSVRERMERMSGMHKARTELSREQQIVQNNINRLKMPEPKENHPDVIDNYYWEINMARRRKKLTLNQLSLKSKIPLEILEALEKGKLPKDFEQVFVILEDFFGITLLKHHKTRINYIIPEVEKEKILNDVRKKIETKMIDEDLEFEELDKRQKQSKIKEIQEGNFDFSNPEKINNITLKDLVDLKKEKEEKERLKKLRTQTEELLGEDLNIDFER